MRPVLHAILVERASHCDHDHDRTGLVHPNCARCTTTLYLEHPVRCWHSLATKRSLTRSFVRYWTPPPGDIPAPSGVSSSFVAPEATSTESSSVPVAAIVSRHTNVGAIVGGVVGGVVGAILIAALLLWFVRRRKQSQRTYRLLVNTAASPYSDAWLQVHVLVERQLSTSRSCHHASPSHQ